MTPEEKQPWEDKAREDKVRYEMEKNMYTGPWKIPAKRKTRKDKNAPRRPMSAFLDFAQDKRAKVRAANPDMANTDVSRELAKVWKEAPQEVRQVHIEKEAKLRAEYKVAIAEWRAKNQRREAAAMLQLSATPAQFEPEPMYALREPVQNPLVASAAAAAAQMYVSSGHPPLTGLFGYPSSTYPPFETNYRNNTWLHGSSTNAVPAYPYEEEQFAAHSGSNNVFGNSYRYDAAAAYSSTGPARSFSGDYDGGTSTRNVNVAAYGTCAAVFGSLADIRVARSTHNYLPSDNISCSLSSCPFTFCEYRGASNKCCESKLFIRSEQSRKAIIPE